ncbi:hypothetical protein [Rhodococcus spongiicola]|uniref:Uncharacterized protein n=1 Tax=Rhodococcus spongiicola TaxID=2487352 RepID=A0A3S3E254_9NOCA|nr:hypothetical protein [Rhodococcus spongiicola]RVW03625.1 hypothetical protein EF834_11075 [Rhodococcus spongiicola]
MLNAIRAGWIVVAWICAGLGVLAATSPMLSITSCELGYPSNGVMPGAECEESVAGRYGPPIVAASAVPSLLCLLPAVFSRRWLAGLVAAVLVLGSVGSFVAGAPQNVFVYFIPAALLAVGLAGWQAWLPDSVGAWHTKRWY